MDRLIYYFEALVKLFTSDLQSAKVTVYTVVSCNPSAQTCSLSSGDPNVSDLTNVSISTPGLVMNLPPGTQVKVTYAGGVPFVIGYAGGAIPSIPPGVGSGVKNEIDAGYVLIVQTAALVISAVYFPAGLAGGIAAEAARAAALLVPGNLAFLLHMNAGRVMPSAWSVP